MEMIPIKPRSHTTVTCISTLLWTCYLRVLGQTWSRSIWLKFSLIYTIFLSKDFFCCTLYFDYLLLLNRPTSTTHPVFLTKDNRLCRTHTIHENVVSLYKNTWIYQYESISFHNRVPLSPSIWTSLPKTHYSTHNLRFFLDVLHLDLYCLVFRY